MSLGGGVHGTRTSIAARVRRDPTPPEAGRRRDGRGAFSGLFGVGGGTIIVPLLILWFGYGEREATGTSLAAIVVIAALAAAGQGAYGNVDVVKGLAIGIPAVGGVIAGPHSSNACRSGSSRISSRCSSSPSPWSS